jgi:hypothetical protein
MLLVLTHVPFALLSQKVANTPVTLTGTVRGSIKIRTRIPQWLPVPTATLTNESANRKVKPTNRNIALFDVFLKYGGMVSREQPAPTSHVYPRHKQRVQVRLRHRLPTAHADCGTLHNQTANQNTNQPKKPAIRPVPKKM